MNWRLLLPSVSPFCWTSNPTDSISRINLEGAPPNNFLDLTIYPDTFSFKYLSTNLFHEMGQGYLSWLICWPLNSFNLHGFCATSMTAYQYPQEMSNPRSCCSFPGGSPSNPIVQFAPDCFFRGATWVSRPHSHSFNMFQALSLHAEMMFAPLKMEDLALL